MRVALTADPELPVPPSHYGGIERIIDLLARGLVARGHDVTLFAHSGSETAGRLIPWRGESSRSKADTILNAITLGRHVLSDRFDLVHSFSRVAYLAPILPLALPKLMTYQREISRRSVRLGHELSRGTLRFSAISKWMIRNVEGIGTWHVVFNGVSLVTYRFVSDPGQDAPLVFLGRIEEVKGPHLAIEIARRVGMHLVLAGSVANEHRAWFNHNIAPHVDGKRVSYIGPVNDAEKNTILGGAKALLMPILWEEPFGIVMAEAMACGTPVIGFRRGAVPEVIEDGVTGFVADDFNELISDVMRISQINRAACRSRAERLFSEDVVVNGYLGIYHEMLGSRAAVRQFSMPRLR
jgi:glycosyltransferase involved in cell wall biosynthesis